MVKFTLNVPLLVHLHVLTKIKTPTAFAVKIAHLDAFVHQIPSLIWEKMEFA